VLKAFEFVHAQQPANCPDMPPKTLHLDFGLSEVQSEKNMRQMPPTYLSRCELACLEPIHYAGALARLEPMPMQVRARTPRAYTLVAEGCIHE
jgi:hypothetical protein